MPSVLLLPLPRFVAYYPGTGAPLAGGFVRTFVPGTSTAKQTYQDPGGTIINPQPIILDSAGSCLLYGTGAIELRVTDALGNAVAGYSGIVSGSSAGGGSISGIAPAGGLSLANNATLPNTSLDIAAGSAADSTGTVFITLPVGLTKSTQGAWSAGNGANALGPGVTLLPSTWYHVLAINNAGSGDVYFDTSVTAAHAPSGTTAYRRIGSFKTTPGTGFITPFSQNGNRFDWVTPVSEFAAAPGIFIAAFIPLVGVPPGVSVVAMVSGRLVDRTLSDSILYLSGASQGDVAPNVAAAITGITPTAIGSSVGYSTTLQTTTLGQIRSRVSSTSLEMTVITNGWIDRRGAS